MQLASLTTERERENYAEKGGNPFLHMLRESLTTTSVRCKARDYVGL